MRFTSSFQYRYKQKHRYGCLAWVHRSRSFSLPIGKRNAVTPRDGLYPQYVSKCWDSFPIANEASTAGMCEFSTFLTCSYLVNNPRVVDHGDEAVIVATC